MRGPPYWGKYIFHDNNRDINYSQMSIAALLGWYLQWHPPIMHELHESEPFMYTFSGQAPQNPTLDPILYGELPWFCEFRDGADDQVRHARRVDARVRRYVVARISRFHVVESQRHDAHVRNLRQRRREHHASQNQWTAKAADAAERRPAADAAAA